MRVTRVSTQVPPPAYGNCYPRGGRLPVQGGKERPSGVLQIVLTQLPNLEGARREFDSSLFSGSGGHPTVWVGTVLQALAESAEDVSVPSLCRFGHWLPW